VAGDKPGQPAYEIFGTERACLTIWEESSLRSTKYGYLKFGCSFKRHYYFIARCSLLPR